jgi:Fe-S-cluster-containing dehydrogenase component
LIIFKNTDNNVTLRNLDSCIGCRTCQVACPFEGCRYDYLNDVVVNCDHCGGNPECVKYCPTEAIKYEELSLVTDYKRLKEASKVLEIN